LVPSIWLKRRCWEGDFHGKVKNNALSIKNECATPKRYGVHYRVNGIGLSAGQNREFIQA
jgi:hypothetical protein